MKKEDLKRGSRFQLSTSHPDWFSEVMGVSHEMDMFLYKNWYGNHWGYPMWAYMEKVEEIVEWTEPVEVPKPKSKFKKLCGKLYILES